MQKVKKNADFKNICTFSAQTPFYRTKSKRTSVVVFKEKKKLILILCLVWKRKRKQGVDPESSAGFIDIVTLKSTFFGTFCGFGSRFRTLAVNIASIFILLLLL